MTACLLAGFIAFGQIPAATVFAATQVFQAFNSARCGPAIGGPDLGTDDLKPLVRVISIGLPIGLGINTSCLYTSPSPLRPTEWNQQLGQRLRCSDNKYAIRSCWSVEWANAEQESSEKKQTSSEHSNFFPESSQSL
jgi:hypothetical protein